MAGVLDPGLLTSTGLSTMTKILLIDDNHHAVTHGAFLNKFERIFLVEQGYDVYSLSFPLTTPKDPTDKDFFIYPPTSRIRQKIGKFLGKGRVVTKVRDAISMVNPDLIHCHLLSVYPADAYAAFGGVPIVQTLHGPNFFCSTSWGCLPNSMPCEMGIGLKCLSRGCMNIGGTLLYTHMHNRLWRNLKNKVSVFHCPSRNIMNTALSLGLNNVVQIPLGINKRFQHIVREDPDGPPTAIFVGNLEKCKGVDVLVEAMRKVRITVMDARLLIAGKGPLEDRLRQRISDLGLGNCVKLLGHLSHEILLEKFAQSHVMVVPSLWKEQFGLVGPEAMACGLPCIGSDIGGIPEWLNHGHSGLLVPPGNVDHLARAITLYLTDSSLAREHGLSAQTYARNAFSLDHYGQQLLELFDRMMNGSI
jgi:glycosyltransferase involved in cell wall biosynthesis